MHIATSQTLHLVGSIVLRFIHAGRKCYLPWCKYPVEEKRHRFCSVDHYKEGQCQCRGCGKLRQPTYDGKQLYSYCRNHNYYDQQDWNHQAVKEEQVRSSPSHHKNWTELECDQSQGKREELNSHDWFNVCEGDLETHEDRKRSPVSDTNFQEKQKQSETKLGQYDEPLAVELPNHEHQPNDSKTNAADKIPVTEQMKHKSNRSRKKGEYAKRVKGERPAWS